MNEYSVTIVETSKELNAKERVQAKDTTDCVVIGKACKTEAILIDVDYWVELHVVNEKSDDKEYPSYVIVDKDGTRYLTGSSSFWNSFTNIWEEVKDESFDWSLKCLQMPSKNREGQTYLTCTLV